MHPHLTPIVRQRLADDLAHRITQLIESGSYRAGDRLPAITSMARQFGVGAPTVREALRKLETVGMIDIRHGSGVYVSQGGAPNALVISNPIYRGAASKKLLVDLLEARTPIEVTTATLAATHATPAHLAELRRLLDRAGEALDDDVALNETNLAFHRGIAVASGNAVLAQLLGVLSSLFREEQRLIIDIHGSRRRDHDEHLGVLDALDRRDPALAAARMRDHLDGVRAVLLRWSDTATQ
jgi:GntR family transcriptional repressor for pyruvate dehydrogenase complex